MKVGIAIPSYKRPKVESLDYLNPDDVWVWVAESEEQDYLKANEKIILKTVPDKVQGNLCRIRNHILKEMFDNHGFDVVLLVDDDLKHIGRYENKTYIPLKGEDMVKFLKKYADLTMQFGFKMFGLNVNTDPQNYREYSPFSTTNYIGGPFQCFVGKPNCWYDEELPLKEDYDMTLQQCNVNRGVLRLNAWSYNVKQNEQTGGCASYRNFNKEVSQLELLQKKWGKKIVKIDVSDRSHKSTKKANFDFNPIIKVPIKGV